MTQRDTVVKYVDETTGYCFDCDTYIPHAHAQDHKEGDHHGWL